MAVGKRNEYVVLKRLLLRKSSDLYMCKNVAIIKKELSTLGIDIDEGKIRSFLLSMKSNGQMLNNSSREKIAQVSRSFILLPCYFRVLHSDIMYLSKNRHYNTRKRLIVTLIDSLSGYAYLESVASTNAKHIVSAFERIFNRSNFLPKGWKRLIVDNGSEYISGLFKQFCFDKKIVLNYVNHRVGRYSKGSGVAENYNRKLRNVIESLKIEEKEQSFENLLLKAERILNAQKLPILDGMSPIEVIRTQDPRYIVSLKSSKRLRRRKWLRNEIYKKKKIDMFSVVRIKIFKDKSFAYKESYGIHTKDLFVVIDCELYNSVWYYKLGFLYTLLPIGNCSYSSEEITVVGISYAYACYKQSLVDIKLEKKLMNGLIEYKIKYCDKHFIGSDDLLKS